ncbi:MAG TPA: OmpA family protein [bacterium]|nr:OmpA family protein [bacterium]
MSLDLKKGKGSADYLKKNSRNEETTAISPIPQKKVDQKTVDQTESDPSTRKPWWILVVLLIGVAATLFFLFKGEDRGVAKEKSITEEAVVADKTVGSDGTVPQKNAEKVADNTAAESQKETEKEAAEVAGKTTPENAVAPDKTVVDKTAEKGIEAEKKSVENANDSKTDSNRKDSTGTMADDMSTHEGRKVTVYFDLNSGELKEEEKAKLASVTSISGLQSILIDGYTCNMGDEEYNRDLSIARAVAVREYLKQTFEGKTKLVIKGSGSGNPIADNDTKEGRLKNRRVEIYY